MRLPVSDVPLPKGIVRARSGDLYGVSESREVVRMARFTPIYPTKRDREIPDAVVNSIYKAYKHDVSMYAEAIDAVRYDSLNGCWAYWFAGMYVGIEESDGYMHT